jgi:hypothetical protein
MATTKNPGDTMNTDLNSLRATVASMTKTHRELCSIANKAMRGTDRDFYHRARSQASALGQMLVRRRRDLKAAEERAAREQARYEDNRYQIDLDDEIEVDE